MSDNKTYYYLKLKENFFDQDAAILLETMPDGYLYENILLKLYLRSLHSEGKLMFNDRIPYSPAMLAAVTRHPVGVVEKAVDIFKDMGLVEILENGTIYMMDIQNFIGKSSTTGDRLRKYRNRVNEEKLALEKGRKDVQMNTKTGVQTNTRDRDRDRDRYRDKSSSLSFFEDNFHPVSTCYEKELLEDMVDEYGDGWVIQAMKEAVKSNARTLRYVDTVLKNWKAHGFGAKKPGRSETLADINDKVKELLPDTPYDEKATQWWLYEEGLTDDKPTGDSTSGGSISDVPGSTDADIRGNAE